MIHKDVKWVAACRTNPFNQNNYRVKVVIFLAQKFFGFFGSDRIARDPTGLARVSLRLTTWLVIFFLLIVKNTFNFNTNHDFLKKFF